MNLDFKGLLKLSDLVVAPIRVKGCMGILTCQPSGITISITKSSIAVYSISSILGIKRCISSINKISHSCNVLSKEIISAGLLMA